MTPETHPEEFAAALTAARHALAPAPGPGARRHATASWEWDLATGRIIWGGGLGPLFGYRELVTDAAWREERIHPEDRERVKLSLQRATIVNQGSVWSERYRFRNADGSYVPVAERAYVVPDAAGPSRVLGALSVEAGPR
jgi:PAS domain-containing protein